jgi:hypothetical protein
MGQVRDWLDDFGEGRILISKPPWLALPAEKSGQGSYRSVSTFCSAKNVPGVRLFSRRGGRYSERRRDPQQADAVSIAFFVASRARINFRYCMRPCGYIH